MTQVLTSAPRTMSYDKERMPTIEPQELSRCLEERSFINLTADRLLISYSQPGRPRHLVPTLNSSQRNDHVCWLRLRGSSENMKLTIDLLAQTCTPDNYVSIHQYTNIYFLTSHGRWRSVQWTGCEYREDPFSVHYLTAVNTAYVGLHVHRADMSYHVSLGVRAAPHLPQSSGGKGVEIKHVTFSSGMAGISCFCTSYLPTFSGPLLVRTLPISLPLPHLFPRLILCFEPRTCASARFRVCVLACICVFVCG